MVLKSQTRLWSIDFSSMRWEAVARIAVLVLWTWTLWPIVSAIGIVAGVVFGVVDILLQLVGGGSGASESGTFGSWAIRLFTWPLEQLTFVIVGGRFPVLP